MTIPSARLAATDRILLENRSRSGNRSGMERKAYNRDIVAARYELRVQHLGREHFVHVRCDGCRRIALIAAAELVRRRKSEKRLVDVAKPLRCQRCTPRMLLASSIYRESVSDEFRGAF
jgi:hypothetical protein